MISRREALAATAAGAVMTAATARAGFRTPQYQEISLSDWLKHSPPDMVAQHLNIDQAVIPRWPGNGPDILLK
jgi:hypothetical protein